MTYLRISDVPPPGPHELVCRQSRLVRIISFSICLAITIGLLLIPATGGFRWFIGFIAFILFLVTWAFFTMLRRTFGPQNWLIRATPTRLLIKFRSFANAHFDPNDPVILEIRPQEVESIGLLKENWLKPRGEGRVPTRDRSTSIEIRLKKADLDELSRRLSEERANMGPGKHSRTRYGDFPLRVVDSSLRLNLRGQMSYVVPSPRKLVDQLSSLLQLTPQAERHQELDLAHPAEDPAAMENQILELAERGDRMGAMTLVRERYGCSLADAKKMVEELCAPARAA